MRRSVSAKPHRRAGIWYLVRRVPREYEHLDARRPVKISTNIAVVDDPKGIRARAVVDQLDRELAAYWRGMQDGSAGEARRRFDEANKRARQVGVPYQTAQELAEGPMDEILRRIQLLIDRNALDDEREVAAIIGGEPRPPLLLSQLVDAFADVKEFALKGMSDAQLHRWRLPKDKAIANLMKVLDGDRDARSLEVADGLKLRVWLQNRIRAEEIEVQTANKQIGDLDNMLRSVEKVHQLGIKPVFRDMRIEGGVDGQRAAFSREWIEKILAPSALDGLNAEARAIVYLVANDGYRPAEVANLLPHRIVLDHPVPHLQVRPDLRRLKTPWSERDIPLVGLSLWTMQQFPEGFPRYRNKEDALSAVVNKYLGQHDLLPTERHSLYSLRHSFEDRMIAVDTPERMKITLMGHKYDRPRYGDGPSLEQKQRLLRQISFMPPGHFGPAA